MKNGAKFISSRSEDTLHWIGSIIRKAIFFVLHSFTILDDPYSWKVIDTRQMPEAFFVWLQSRNFFFLVTNFDKWKYRLTFSLWNEQFHLGLLEKNWTISFLESLSTQTELFTEEGPLIC